MSQYESLEARYQSAERLIGELLDRHEAGSPVNLEALVEAHPHLEAELRQLGGNLEDIDQALALRRGELAAERAQVEHMLNEMAATPDFGSRYSIKGEFRRGGMGAVLRVMDRKLGRPLAMKVILGQVDPGRSGTTPAVAPRQLARFLNEARITSRLEHPGIVPVYEVGVDPDGRAYFTMKLVKGRTLAEVFALHKEGDQEWSREHILSLLQRACDALAYAHGQRVIHRDLKPANIMVGDFGEVYVMDWGLAHKLGEPQAVRLRPEGAGDNAPLEGSLTRDGAILGTPEYMPPEQATSRFDEIGPASDVYSLGAMLYELLAGYAPYREGPARVSTKEIVARITRESPRPLELRAAPAELIAICDKAMARETNRRYADMHALASDLKAFLEGRVVAAHRSGPVIEARKWITRNRGFAAAVGSALLALLAGFLVSGLLYLDVRRNAEQAGRNEQRALRGERLANGRADEVLQLSALQELDELIAEADSLWPVGPERVAQYESWIQRAHALVGDLPMHEARREEIRRNAQPWTEAERSADLLGHPDYPVLQAVRKEIEYREALVHRLQDRVEFELPAVDFGGLTSAPMGLNNLAWNMVDPSRTTFGGEAMGLVLSKRAFKESNNDDLCIIGDTVAWAYFALGRDEEALLAYDRVVAAARGGEKTRWHVQRERLRTAVLDRATPEGRSQEQGRLDLCRRNESELVARMSARRTWHFEDGNLKDRWWNDQLSKLIEGLGALRDGLLAEDVAVVGHGWSIPMRLKFSRQIEERSVGAPDVRLRWKGAISGISDSPLYGGLVLTPQRGLMPIGSDPDSGLWEFAELQTGEPPARGPDGRLAVGPQTGLVLVLVPGGSFWMGAQAENPALPNFDPMTDESEGPVRQVVVSPFFLSKFEVTNAQWKRIGGPHNCDCHGRPLGPAHNVSWQECNVYCQRLGLDLPSEAQWEYAARAGTDTPWSTGRDSASLEGHANLADQSLARYRAAYQHCEPWNDGWQTAADIGSFLPSPFGLHDLYGNVREWCLDVRNVYSPALANSIDPVVLEGLDSSHMQRGGGYFKSAAAARSSSRTNNQPGFRDADLGLRPLRRIDK